MGQQWGGGEWKSRKGELVAAVVTESKPLPGLNSCSLSPCRVVAGNVSLPRGNLQKCPRSIGCSASHFGMAAQVGEQDQSFTFINVLNRTGLSLSLTRSYKQHYSFEVNQALFGAEQFHLHCCVALSLPIHFDSIHIRYRNNSWRWHQVFALFQ